MTVFFHINYHTIPGQALYVLGSIPELGSDRFCIANQMTWTGNGDWVLKVEIPSVITCFSYQYALEDTDGSRILEPWNRMRYIQLDAVRQNVCHVYDHWRLEPSESDIIFYTSAFTKNIFAREAQILSADFSRTVAIRVHCPRIKKDQQLAITGNQPCLGKWKPERAKMLHCTDFPEWEIHLDANEIAFPFEYKFFVCDTIGCAIHWESGENRVLPHISCEERATMLVHDYPYRDSQPEWRGAGTVIPVFSLRSVQSFGVGDFSDLRLLVDWAVQTNQQLIQILPMNDTTRTHTWADSYPYSAISIYALHPMYISLPALGRLCDREKMDYFEEVRVGLNKEKTVDYERVEMYKMQYLRAFFEQEGDRSLKSDAFGSFFRANQDWLIPYAAFCYYREKYQTADFLKWKNDANYNPDCVQQLCRAGSEAYSDVLFTYFLQFVLHSQFKSVSEYARQNGVVLKGDLPIGIHRMSVEAWMERAYFNMEGQAGAPPDDFSAIGQNWSFPTYNWDVMEKDGYVWWKKRFHKLGDYYDSFRIDHILGFFRIWEIPCEYVQGLCGHFRSALPFTVAEIESFGLLFDEQWTIPQIHRDFLSILFGDLTESVLDTYLTFIDVEHVVLKPFCDTQQKIEYFFNSQIDTMSVKVKEGLFALANEVLFLRDPYEPSTYHPRISAYLSFRYRELNNYERAAFDKLSDCFFYERHNEYWRSEALKRLTPLISSTEMLICGEDLGMIPDSVHEVMEQLHLLSLELERTPKSEGVQFSDLNTLPYLSVCTTSTHDMNPLRNWWEEDSARSQIYYHSVLHHNGKAPEICTTPLAMQIISNHLRASSMLTIIPLQDWLAMSDELKNNDADHERINIPADPHHYWCYRMHITLEELLSAHDFNQKISDMLSINNR